MKVRHAALAAGLALGLMSGTAHAALVTFAYEDPNSSPNLGFQRYTVTSTGIYQIDAYGAQGGAGGGNGAEFGGQFSLTSGEVLTFVIGGQGGIHDSSFGPGGGGGGGTFVLSGNNQPLVVAGGGGGAGSGVPGDVGQTTNSGSSGFAGAQGGTAGAGGGFNDGGGGGGFYGNGGGGNTGGKALIFGASSGSSLTENPYGTGPSGGFGGGGGAAPGNGGGGGGYSGGGGGAEGGGGGSYLSSIALSNGQVAIAGANSGNGYATLELLQAVSSPNPSIVPLPSSAPMFGAALLAVGAAGYVAKRKKAATT